MTQSAIEWTQRVWNPIVGCSIVSPGCTNCYAMSMAARIEAMNTVLPRSQQAAPQYDGTTRRVNGKPVWTGKVELAEAKLLEPLRRKVPTTWFVNSMGDLFHESVPDAWVDKVFAVMALTPQHTYQVLTKRAQRMRQYLADCSRMLGRQHEIRDAIKAMAPDTIDRTNAIMAVSGSRRAGQWKPLPNVWLGVSTERQQEADERIPDLLATPAAVRFISAEPLLGPIDLRALSLKGITSPFDALCHGSTYTPNAIINRVKTSERFYHSSGHPTLDWVIVGGESGPDARPMHPKWERDLRDQCAAAGTAFFKKQQGEWMAVCAMTEDMIDAVYIPAPAHQPEATRRCRVPRLVMHADGTIFRDISHPRAYAAGSGAMLMFKVGKKRAGRALDGMIHHEYPEIRQ